MVLLGGCSSNARHKQADNGNAVAPVVTSSPTTTTTTTTVAAAQLPSGSYDTSIGDGVDANGYANLPLRAGAHRYFVSSATGSDGNGCAAGQQPGTPLRTIAAAIACVQGGNGDQVLVAEGTSYGEGLPNLDARAGYSAMYPTVVQSYDPSDPTNEGKYGRAASGRRPVVNTGANEQPITCCAMNPASYLAIRGFDINPGNKPDMKLYFNGSNNLPNNYILVENNIFRYTQLTLGGNGDTHHIIRKNAFYGQWSPTAHAQGVYEGATNGITVEDNVFWHVGWKVGANRDDDPSIGGPTIFRHSIYQQDDTANAVIRRNLFMDPSATGCSCRSSTSIQENVFIDNPLAIIAGLGNNYNVYQPNGVAIDVGYNAIIGDADINSANPRGSGIKTGNGTSGSRVHNNLIARSRNPNGYPVAFSTDANYNQPSYALVDHNVAYLWSTAANTAIVGGDYGSTQAIVSYTNNIWDAATSGTNTNNAGISFPNPYTEAQLFTALGCSDKASCAAKMIETPELGWAVKARALLWQGYGMQ
jgi:hypothetical protein